MSRTHEVLNQVPSPVGLDLTTTPALVEGLRREGAGWAEAEVREQRPLAEQRGGTGVGSARQRAPAGAQDA